MDSAGSARHSLAVATIVVAIALSCAAAVGGGTGPIPGNTAASAPSSLLTKLPQPQLPKFPVIYTYGKNRGSPRPPTTNHPTSPVNNNKQQQLQRPSPQQQPQQPSKPQKRPPKPTTVDERPGGRDQPYQSSSSTNASVTTSPRPKLETTTHDRAIITVPLKACPDGQRMGPDRNCRPDFPDPESDRSK
ncbi:hypothetical protein ACI65C_003760 [Semiaphis heraclei]